MSLKKSLKKSPKNKIKINNSKVQRDSKIFNMKFHSVEYFRLGSSLEHSTIDKPNMPTSAFIQRLHEDVNS